MIDRATRGPTRRVARMDGKEKKRTLRIHRKRRGGGGWMRKIRQWRMYSIASKRWERAELLAALFSALFCEDPDVVVPKGALVLAPDEEQFLDVTIIHVG